MTALVLLRVSRCSVYIRKFCFYQLILIGMVCHKDTNRKNTCKCQESKNENTKPQKGVYLGNLLLARLLFNEVACSIKTILHTVQRYQVPYAPRFHSISWMRLQKVLCSAPITELTVGLRAVPCANPAVDHSLQTSGFIFIYPASVWPADVAQTTLSTCKCSSLAVLKA